MLLAPSPCMVSRVWVGLVLSSIAGCAVSSPESQGASSDAVQESASEQHYVVASSLTGADRTAQRATAALFVPWMNGAGAVRRATDGTPIRATCGATFIDRTHALTASHCVEANDVPDPANDDVELRFIEAAPNVGWRGASRLTGTFPDYAHPEMTSGYSSTSIVCHVAVRCGKDYGSYACPPAATATDSDIALLECADGLPADREPVPVAASDDEHGAVRMFWFHEIYAVPSANGGTDKASRDLFAHYTAHPAQPEDNFHYFGGDRNQLLPLASVSWANGSPRTRIGRDPSSAIVWTDMFGCHGSSGSGIMQRNAATGVWELVGPARSGGDWANDYLCANPATLKQGQRSIGYIALEITQEVAALAATPR